MNALDFVISGGTDRDADEIIEVLKQYFSKKGYEIKVKPDNNYYESQRIHMTDISTDAEIPQISILLELKNK